METTGERSRNSDDIRCFGVCDDFAWKMNLTIDAALTLSLNPVLKGLCGVGRVGLSSRFGMQMIVAKESSSWRAEKSVLGAQFVGNIIVQELDRTLE